MLLQVGGGFIPPPNIAGPLASLGRSIGQIINPNAQFEQMLNQMLLLNPQAFAPLAQAQREAERQAEQTRAAGEAGIRALRPEEVQAAATAAEPLPEPARVAAERAVTPPPDVTGGVAPAGFLEQVLALNPPTFEEEARVALRDLRDPQGRTFGELQALGQFEQAQTLILENTFKRELTQSEREKLVRYNEAVAKLPTGLQKQLEAFSANPVFLEAIIRLMEMNSAQIIAALKATGDPLERAAAELALVTDFNDQFSTLVTEFEEATDPGVRGVVLDRMNQLEEQRVRALTETGVVNYPRSFVADPKFGFITGKMNGFELARFRAPNLPEAENQLLGAALNLATDLYGQGMSTGEILESMLSQPRIREIWNSLPQEERDIMLEGARRAGFAQRGEAPPVATVGGEDVGAPTLAIDLILEGAVETTELIIGLLDEAIIRSGALVGNDMLRANKQLQQMGFSQEERIAIQHSKRFQEELANVKKITPDIATAVAIVVGRLGIKGIR